MLFHWFVGLSMDDEVWDHSTFTKNRNRFLQSDLAADLFSRVLHQAERHRLLSDEHFIVSTTDLDARLYRKGKGKEARLAFMGHALMENRNGLVVDTRLTVGVDKGYDTRDFIDALRELRTC